MWHKDTTPPHTKNTDTHAEKTRKNTHTHAAQTHTNNTHTHAQKKRYA